MPSEDFPINTAKKILETSGPTVLTVSNIIDGQYLKRSGNTIVSADVSGSGLTHGQVMSRVFLGA